MTGSFRAEIDKETLGLRIRDQAHREHAVDSQPPMKPSNAVEHEHAPG